MIAARLREFAAAGVDEVILVVSPIDERSIRRLGDVVAAVAQEPKMLRIRRLTGNTNIPVNPFRKYVSRFGHSSDVVTEAVVSR